MVTKKTAAGSDTIPRSMWAGTLSCGLIVIGIKLYAATEDHSTAFRQVHDRDGGRIKYRRFCSQCGEEVPYAEIAKGYESPDGTITVLTDEDMDALPLPTAKTVEVMEFVKPGEVPAMLHHKSYYMRPGVAGANDVYKLIAEALAKTKRVGLCKVAIRQRESLAELRNEGGLLILDTLLWPDEVRRMDAPDGTVNKALLTQVVTLVEAMAGEFNPEDHNDEYAEAVARMVEAKLLGAGPVKAPEPKPAGPGNLMDVLAASIEDAKKKSKKKGAA